MLATTAPGTMSNDQRTLKYDVKGVKALQQSGAELEMLIETVNLMYIGYMDASSGPDTGNCWGLIYIDICIYLLNNKFIFFLLVSTLKVMSCL